MTSAKVWSFLLWISSLTVQWDPVLMGKG